MTLIVTLRNINGLIPYAEFEKDQKLKLARIIASYNPMPSPMLGRSPATDRQNREHDVEDTN